MGAEFQNLQALLNESKTLFETLNASDKRRGERVDEIQRSVDELLARAQRPGAESSGPSLERKAAREYAQERYYQTTAKTPGDYEPSPSEVDEAIVATKALQTYARFGTARLDQLSTKSLSQFNLGSNGFLVPPQWSSRILDCTDDPTDLSGLVSSETITGNILKFFADSSDFKAAWACQTDCFANQSSPNVTNFGEVNIAAEELRFAVCSDTSILEDSGFNLEAWLQRKVATAFRDAISESIIKGSGNGMPSGILTPGGGVPVCEVSDDTPEGQVDWRDILMLVWQIPQKWHNDISLVMNAQTLAMLATSSDAIGRPLLLPSARDGANGLTIAGFRVVIASQMPSISPGATPILAANLRELYTLVLRRGITMSAEPLGWCRLFRWSSRIGGGLLCPNAGRLLRIR